MNIFKQFYKSIYSPKDIASFRFQGIGKTILFVFFLTFISILPSVVFLSTILTTGLETAKNVINDEIPSFTISEGELTTDSNAPIIIRKDDFSIMIDSTGTLTQEDVEKEGNAFALLTNQFVLAAGGRTDPYDYAMLEGIDITKEDFVDIIDTIDSLKGIIIPVMSLFIYLFSSAASFIEVTVLALFGLALKNLSGRKLTYGQLWRMSAYAETLPTLFFTIMAILKTPVPNSFIINWFVAIIVLYLAIKEVPKSKQEIPEL
ncbi:DUF1189 domain-containing protein [Bacillus sp. MRMR6]|uniref:DUF1189 domain-containing protein n=1 Tax=Bacillus sp. MRMR6 TaxID=1928617 RepID=UPI000951EE95|nr:DUF1189 domain-containing protein [Bacillus sp. MRMR6]OLS41676.1 hypothetical protein BTR25_03770 [Bacillus sp. MRMR6]